LQTASATGILIAMSNPPDGKPFSIRPRNGLKFSFGLLYLLLAILNFSGRDNPHGSAFQHYVWIGWLVPSAWFLYTAFLPKRAKRAN